MRRVCGHALQLFITERIVLNHPTRGVCRGGEDNEAGLWI